MSFLRKNPHSSGSASGSERYSYKSFKPDSRYLFLQSAVRFALNFSLTFFQFCPIAAQKRHDNENDFTSLPNIMNEMYAGGLRYELRHMAEQRKIREHLTTIPPYGYKKAPEDNVLIVRGVPQAAPAAALQAP